MAEGFQHTFTGGEEGQLAPFAADCVERQVPGLGATWVHGYRGRDVAMWRYLAGRMAKAHGDARVKGTGGDPQPTPECLQVCQALTVCRRGPQSEAATFVVAHGAEHQAYDAVMTSLPGTWIEEICRDSDLLTMRSYHRLEDPRQKQQAQASLALPELLADDDFWTSLNYLSLRLYGVPIAENGQPLGEVLTVMAHDAAARDGLLAAVGALASAVG